MASHAKASRRKASADMDYRAAGVPKRISSLSQQVDVFVHNCAGTNPIYSILVANNGIAAVKFIRSIRKWAYATFGSEKAICLVAMATHMDIKSNAEHIHMADQFVEVPGGGSAENYGNVKLIAQIASQAAVDAVWPGWGHASEKPELPRILHGLDITFLGPREAAMAALGDKIASTILAQSAGVPTLPWSGSGVSMTLQPSSGEVTIPDAVYQSACIHSVDEAVTTCHKIGYPAMLKASWGGGGKGIRRVCSDEDVELLYKQVRGEVPGSPVFTMRLAPQSRHLEVQLLCDQYGGVVSLYTRDCSVQRRHQKIIEEGPATIAPAETLLEMEACARRLAASVGYVGAATVEFLYVLHEQQYYFLELNPRLQVEHPVTEWLSGVNIPACQVMIGMGIPLRAIPEITALFPRSLDFDTAEQVRPAAHVVAVRITSEHAEDGFKPTCGTIDELHFRSTPEVWGYFSVKPGSKVHEFSDSQFGHVFAKGESRAAAVRAIVVALKELRVRGEIRTLVDYVVDMLQETAFAENRIHTGWLDARIAAQVRVERPPWHLSVIAGAVDTAFNEASANVSEYLKYLEKGQAAPTALSLTSFTVDLTLEADKYHLTVHRTAPDMMRLYLNHSAVDVGARKLSDGSILIQVDGCAHVVHAEKEVTGTRLIIDNLTCLLPNEHDPSSLRAPSPGKLLRFLVEDGAAVEQDEPFAEMEAMKQIMLMIAPASGSVHFAVPEGCSVLGGELVASLDLDNPEGICTGRPFTGGFPELAKPQVAAEGLSNAFQAALRTVGMVITGYIQDVDCVVAELAEVLAHPELPFAIWDEQWATLQSALPAALSIRLSAIVSAHHRSSSDSTGGSGGRDVAAEATTDTVVASSLKWSGERHLLSKTWDSTAVSSESGEEGFPAQLLRQELTKHIERTPIKEQRIVESATAGAMAALQQLEGGINAPAWHTTRDILDKFLVSEAPFLDHRELSEPDAIDALRKQHASDLQHVLNVILSHQALPRKAELVLGILDTLVAQAASHFKLQLVQLAALPTVAPLGRVVQRAQQLLDHALLSELSVAIASALISPVTPASSADASEEQSGARLSAASHAEVTSTAVGDLELESLEQAAAKVLHDLQNRASLNDRLAVLVNAPAAIEEAVALVLGTPNQDLRRAACLAYIHRLYSAFLVTQPVPLPGRLPGYQWCYEAAISSGATDEAPCTGLLLLPDSLNQLPELLAKLASSQKLHVDVLHIVYDPSSNLAGRPPSKPMQSLSLDTEQPGSASNGTTAETLALEEASLAVLHACTKQLLELGVADVSILRVAPSSDVHRTGFRAERGAYERAPILSFIEPPTACMLETDTLPRVLQYVPSYAHQLHTFIAEEKSTVSSQYLRRAFMRVVIRRISTPDLLSALYQQHAAKAATAAIAEVEAVLPRCLHELQRLAAQSASGPSDWVHIFVSLLPPLPLSGEAGTAVHIATALRAAAAQAAANHATTLRKAAVAEWTIRIRSSTSTHDRSSPRGWRIVVSLPSGHESGEDSVSVFQEVVDEDAVLLERTGHNPAKSGISKAGPREAILAAVPPLSPLQQRRLQARRHNTTYCYDFPAVFEDALRSMWAEYEADTGRRSLGGALVETTELVLQDGNLDYRRADAPLVPIARPIGSNNVGVVVWVLMLRTPEWPHGRQVVAIANDITFQAGALSPSEHAVFRAAADLAHQRQLPLIYLAANSGAKVGLDQELKRLIQVKWVSEEEPWKGFEYLYLSNEAYQAARQRSVGTGLPFRAEEVREGSTVHWRVTDIIGTEDGVGVECLSGSAATAAAFSRGFDCGFTITLVTGRTVGIGAYLARLGRRVIQRADQPIILTGFQALNKLLGRPVYSSQMQLGGPRVMAQNGVSHMVVHDDLQGVKAILDWLSYAPLTVGGEHTIHDVSMRLGGDSAPRAIAYTPPHSHRFNLREAVTGCVVDGEWAAGLFDRGSWREYQTGWAQTVITGRARLEGHPVAVLGVEAQAVTVSVPADPGMPSSSEQQISQAGQVWYPDSAKKTADALQEFDREGLPLVILANWRGFSGGKRDLFEGVLQAGSCIVESLRQYRWPVMVYMPPGCDLRGGAWVVIDSQINSSMVEMYADPSARGNVLEAEGVVEIKFRKKDLLALMSRCDAEIVALTAAAREQASADAALRARQEQLLPVYHSIAVHFATMHDTPVRMVEKGVLKAIVPWRDARRVLATRLRRRLAEDAVRAHVASADPSVQRLHALQLIQSWYARSAADVDSSSSSPGNGQVSCGSSGVGLDTVEHCEPTGCSHDRLVARDEHFLEWLNSAQGAAKIGAELKKLKRNAAAATVLEVARSQEGREGLLQALESMFESNLSLKAQLASMITS